MRMAFQVARKLFRLSQFKSHGRDVSDQPPPLGFSLGTMMLRLPISSKEDVVERSLVIRWPHLQACLQAVEHSSFLLPKNLTMRVQKPRFLAHLVYWPCRRFCSIRVRNSFRVKSINTLTLEKIEVMRRFFFSLEDRSENKIVERTNQAGLRVRTR